jgi:hypothetical protein
LFGFGRGLLLRLAVRGRRGLCRRVLGASGYDPGEFGRCVHSGQPGEHLLPPAFAAVDQRHLPAGRQRAEDVLERISGVLMIIQGNLENMLKGCFPLAFCIHLGPRFEKETG